MQTQLLRSTSKYLINQNCPVFVFQDDAASSLFLLGHPDCDVNALVPETLDSPLHLVAKKGQEMTQVARTLIEKRANVNAQNKLSW